MNKKKAGEDFYFLQKIFPHGGIENITTAKITPSPRPSDRVPFGTGRAINERIINPDKTYSTYNIKSFVDLKSFIDLVPKLYQEKELDSMLGQLPTSMLEFLHSIDFSSNFSKIKTNSKSEKQFLKSFYQWFNGFTVLKFVHFARDNFYENMEVLEAANWIVTNAAKGDKKINDKRLALRYLRELDRLN